LSGSDVGAFVDADVKDQVCSRDARDVEEAQEEADQARVAVDKFHPGALVL
jgi:hypothetical protein